MKKELWFTSGLHSRCIPKHAGQMTDRVFLSVN